MALPMTDSQVLNHSCLCTGGKVKLFKAMEDLQQSVVMDW